MAEGAKQKGGAVEMLEIRTDVPEDMVEKKRVEKVFNEIYWKMLDGNQRSVVVNGAKELLGEFMPRKVVE